VTRPTDLSGERFYQRGLTGLRALAAAWVMMFHLNGMVGPRAMHVFGVEVHPLLTVGWVGVNIFFVLSGFLLTTHLMETGARRGVEASLPRYLEARVRRVFPAYWIQLLVLLVVTLLATGALPTWLGYLPLHVPMLHHLSETANGAINPVYWTLPIEFSFYLCLPFFARMLLGIEAIGAGKWKKLVTLYLVTLACAIGYRVLVFRIFPGAQVGTLVWAMGQLPGSLDEFMIGSAAAVALRWLRLEGRYPPPATAAAWSSILALLGFAGIVAMIYSLDSVYATYWKGHWLMFAWYSITCIFIAMVVTGTALGGPITRLLFENRVVYFLGLISYSIYLWHFPIGDALARALDAKSLGIGMFSLIAIPSIVAASALSYYLAERPFLRSRAAAGAEPSPAAASASAK